MIKMSDANPIQFVPAHKPSYNRIDTVGMYKEKFYQKFEYKDRIVICFSSDSFNNYELKTLDENDIVISVQQFNRVQFGIVYFYFQDVPLQQYAVSGDRCISFTITDIIENVIEYYTDLIHLADAHRGTTVITYKDKNNFANILHSIFENSTFDGAFSLRISCKFYDFRFPDETEAEDVSNSNVVVLSSSTKSQRLLEVECCPAFMHKKIQLALQHNTVVIDGTYWVKEDSYSLTELDPRFPLKTGKVWLTEKNGEFITNTFAENSLIPNRVFDRVFDNSFDKNFN